MFLLRIVVALALLLWLSVSGTVAVLGLGSRCAAGRLLREGQCAPEGPAGSKPQILWKSIHAPGTSRQGAASSAAVIGAWGGAQLLRGGGSSGETQALGFAETQALRFGTQSPDPSPAHRHLNLQLWEASRRGCKELLAGLVHQGAEVDAAFEARDGSKKNALHFATLSGRRDIVIALLQAGADITCVDDEVPPLPHLLFHQPSSFLCTPDPEP